MFEDSYSVINNSDEINLLDYYYNLALIPNGIGVTIDGVLVGPFDSPIIIPIGVQYGWYYSDGNALVLTSIPNQIVGVAGGISTTPYTGSTSNVFTFGITNNSVLSKTVDYGYIRIS